MNKYLKTTCFRKKPLRNQKGFTLIEMIAAITLLGVLGLFSTQFITGAAETNRLASGQKGLLDDAKLAMEFMIREIRMANTDPTSGGANITTPGNNSIVFTKFFGLPIDSTTAITYDLSGNNLNRTGQTTTTLASQITGFTITETPNGSNFYRITLSLAGANGTNFTLESGVRPRSKTQ